jgi:hypothetical protein
MKRLEVEQIIEALPDGRTEFAYRAGDYASHLMRYHVGSGRSVRAIKNGPFSRLLNTDAIRQHLPNAGDGMLRLPDSEDEPVPHDRRFTLTLGRWGRDVSEGAGWWHQTSRPGFNLVLHVNFPDAHNKRYLKMFGSKSHDECPFENRYHPHCQLEGHWTMAWVRLDVDLDRGEALIEEIQSDWIREAHSSAGWLLDAKDWQTELHELDWYHPKKHKKKRVWRYLTNVMPPMQKIWAEATFTAAIWFLRSELGIQKIYYHTWHGGRRLKASDGPRSIYVDLPKKFCFRRTTRPPALFTGSSGKVVRRLGKIKPLDWFVLEL